MNFEIVLSTYNGGDFLEEQIKSIIKQKHKDWNLLIFDDSSTDNTIEILDYYSKIDSRIEFKINNKKLGPTYSFYNLLKSAKKDFLVFCDQDDIWSDMKLYEINEFIISSKKSFLMGLHNGEFLIEKENKVFFNKKLISNEDLIYNKKPNLCFFSLLKSNKLIGCCSFINRKAIINLIKINPPKNEGIFLDYLIALLASSKSQIKYLDKNLIYYRRHENVATISQRSITAKLKTKFIIVSFLILNYIKYRISRKIIN